MTENIDNISMQNQAQDNEIDLLALAKQVWKRRVFIIIVTVVFFVLGLIVAMTSSKIYTAETTFIVQSAESSSRGGNLAGLASLAGVSVGGQSSSSNELSPVLYPMIIQSTPFQLKLMKEKYSYANSPEELPLEDYLAQNTKLSVMSTLMKYTIGLPGLIFGSKEEPSNSDISTDNKLMKLTEDEHRAKNYLKNNISVELNSEERSVILTANTGDPALSAQLIDKTYELLQSEILDNKTATAKQKLEYVSKLYDEKKKEYTKAQLALASYRDRNSNIISARAQTEGQRLENEYQLAFSIFSDISKQKEQAKLKVQDNTPILKIIEPVRIPEHPSKPNKTLIIIIFIFLGGILGIGFVFLQDFIKGAKKHWNQLD